MSTFGTFDTQEMIAVIRDEAEEEAEGEEEEAFRFEKGDITMFTPGIFGIVGPDAQDAVQQLHNPTPRAPPEPARKPGLLSIMSPATLLPEPQPRASPGLLSVVHPSAAGAAAELQQQHTGQSYRPRRYYKKRRPARYYGGRRTYRRGGRRFF